MHPQSTSMASSRRRPHFTTSIKGRSPPTLPDSACTIHPDSTHVCIYMCKLLVNIVCLAHAARDPKPADRVIIFPLCASYAHCLLVPLPSQLSPSQFLFVNQSTSNPCQVVACLMLSTRRCPPRGDIRQQGCGVDVRPHPDLSTILAIRFDMLDDPVSNRHSPHDAAAPLRRKLTSQRRQTGWVRYQIRRRIDWLGSCQKCSSGSSRAHVTQSYPAQASAIATLGGRP